MSEKMDQQSSIKDLSAEPTDEAKRKERRELNRLAAERYRKRRTDHQTDLIREVSGLRTKRNLLQNDLCSLRAHKSYLLFILNEHRPNCRLSKSPKEKRISSDGLEEKRERNRLATARCRKRQADKAHDLINEVSGLAEKLKQLQNELGSLRAHKSHLLFILSKHRAKCPYWIPFVENTPSIKVPQKQ